MTMDLEGDDISNWLCLVGELDGARETLRTRALLAFMELASGSGDESRPVSSMVGDDVVLVWCCGVEYLMACGRGMGRVSYCRLCLASERAALPWRRPPHTHNRHHHHDADADAVMFRAMDASWESTGRCSCL